MVSGFNTNIRYRGVLFHVQSEASDAGAPQIRTHLFKGGDILASIRGDCSVQLDSDDLEREVRILMQNQHKSMLRALGRGDHDAAIVARLGADAFAGENGTDSDVTLPPPETLPAVEVSPEPAFATATVEATAGPGSAKEQWSRAFGDGVVSDKPLDEVVLDFLVDNARKRAQE